MFDMEQSRIDSYTVIEEAKISIPCFLVICPYCGDKEEHTHVVTNKKTWEVECKKCEAPYKIRYYDVIDYMKELIDYMEKWCEEE